MATYLICPRKKGLQKKHIDICHRCDFNASCKPFHEYIQDKTETESHESSISDKTQSISADLLRDILKELKEIKILLAGRETDEESYPAQISNNSASKDISIDFLKKELKMIKAL